MAYASSIEERFEGMAKRLERAEQANRAMKIWGSIAFVALMTFGSGPFASDATAKKNRRPGHSHSNARNRPGVRGQNCGVAQNGGWKAKPCVL